MTGNSLPSGNLTMGRFANLTGCNRETIRYYERIGLLASPARSSAGYRLYAASDTRRLRFILRCRQLGFSIDEIRGLLGLVDGNSYRCSDVQALTQTHLKQVTGKIEDLRTLEHALKEMVDSCNGAETPGCPIIDTLFQGSR